MTPSDRPTRRLTMALGALTALGAAAIDMYLPALPAIDRELATGAVTAQQTLSAFFLGLAAGQLIYGPLSDRFGRRPVIAFGVVLFVVTSLVCAFANSMETLLLGRFFQALAASAGAIVGRAVVRDLYRLDDAARAQSFIQLVFLMTPLLAPTIGGYIALWFDWPAIFIALAGFGGLCLVALVTLLPETLPAPRRRPLNPAAVFTAYGAVLRHKRSMGCILTGGFAFACMFTYFAESALVFTRLYGVAEQDYGLLFALNVLGLMAANFLNGRVVGRFGTFAMLAVGAALVWLGAMVLLAVAWTGFGGLWGLVLPLMLVVGSLGLVGANAMAAALEPFGDRAGLAASLQGFMQMTIGALAAFLVGQFHDGSAMPMAVTIAVLASLSLAARVFLVGHVPRDAQPS